MSSYDHRPVNPNGRGISRSGFVSGFSASDRHPTDPSFDWPHAALIAMIAVGVVFAIAGAFDVPMTLWGEQAIGGAR